MFYCMFYCMFYFTCGRSLKMYYALGRGCAKQLYEPVYTGLL